MRRIRRRTIKTESHTLLYLAAGAVAGAAAGVLLSRRFPTRRDFFDAVRNKIGTLREYWEAAAIDEDGRHERDLVDAYELDDDLTEEDVHEQLVGAEASATFARDNAEPSIEDDIEDDIEDQELAEEDESPDEHSLEHRVLAAFEADPVLQSRAVDIAAVGASVVELSGWVRSLDEASRAASVARRVPGVSMVLNRLSIRGEGDVETESVVPPADETRVSDAVVRPSTTNSTEGRGETSAS